MSDRLQNKYDYRDLVDSGVSFTGLEITDAGSGEFYLSNEVLFFSTDFTLNTEQDESGTNITGFDFIDKNDFLTVKWGKDVYEKIKVTDVTYQTGDIYAFGDIAGSDLKATDANNLQGQIDALMSGTSDALLNSVHWFGNYKDRSAEGLLPFALNNAISQANYSAQWDEVGHMYNEQHVGAGDADLSGSSTLFYPTPVPGGYDRAGAPDSATIDATTGVDDSAETIALVAADISSLKLTRGVIGTGADGVPVQVKLVTGALPGGLAILTTYYCRFKTATTLELYDTEAHSIDTGAVTGRVNLTDAVGTFRLTQEGIVLGDAFQGFNMTLDWESRTNAGTFINDATGRKYFVNTYTANVLHSSQTKADTFIADDKGNGTPRVSNESRGRTTILFAYIKAEHITSAGETISALKYDTGWINRSDWTNVHLGSDDTLNTDSNVAHNLDAALSELNVKLFISTDGTDANSFEPTIMRYTSGTAYQSWSPLAVDDNNIKIQTALYGLGYTNDSGVQAVINTQSYYYKVIITKPNLTNVVFDVSSLPKTYDLTSANATKTLPAITGALQTVSFYWTNGGTYKLSLAVTDGKTVGGIAAATWEGEGEGHMLLESDGSNWQVREYEDRIDSSGKIYTKLLNGDMTYKGWGAKIGSGTDTLSDTGNMTRFVSLKNIKGVVIGAKTNPAPSDIIDLSILINNAMICAVSTITTWEIRLFRSGSTFGNTHHYGYGIEIEGRWRT